MTILSRRSLVAATPAVPMIVRSLRPAGGDPTPSMEDETFPFHALTSVLAQKSFDPGSSFKVILGDMDFTAQLAAVSVTPPEDRVVGDDHSFYAATTQLPFPSSAPGPTRREIWPAAFGFGLAAIDQLLCVGTVPDTVTVLRGRFDRDAIRSTRSSGGYRAGTVAGIQTMISDEGLGSIARRRRYGQPGSEISGLVSDDLIVLAANEKLIVPTAAAVAGDPRPSATSPRSPPTSSIDGAN